MNKNIFVLLTVYMLFSSTLGLQAMESQQIIRRLPRREYQPIDRVLTYEEGIGSVQGGPFSKKKLPLTLLGGSICALGCVVFGIGTGWGVAFGLKALISAIVNKN